MKKYSFVILACIFLACENIYEYGNGNLSSESKSVPEFSTIQANGPFEIDVEEGNSEKVRILTDENLHQYIEIDVRGDQLIIETTERIQSDDGIKVYITYDQLEGIELEGASVLTSGSTIDASDFFIDVQGASVVELDLDVKNLEIDLSGAGIIELSGNAKRQSIEISGAGNLNAYDLRCRDAKIELSGLGGAQVYVSESLYGKVSGVGSIKYKGNPEEVASEVSGVGTVSQVPDDEESDVQIDI